VQHAGGSGDVSDRFSVFVPASLPSASDPLKLRGPGFVPLCWALTWE